MSEPLIKDDRTDKRMINDNYKHSELTSKVIGCAMTVQSTLGNGFQEVIYQRALALEMKNCEIGFLREFEMPIFYQGTEIGTRRADFLVEDNVMVELKAISKLENIHLTQALNYLEAYKLDIGLLLNFGAEKLEFRRIINECKNK